MGQSPLLSQEQGGELAGGTASQWKLGDWTTRRGRSVDGGGGGVLLASPPHSAVASQLVPRMTWRHLVSVSTGAGTADGCGRFSSAPVGADEAADARLQGVAGVVTPEWEEPSEKGPFAVRHAPLLHSLTFLTSSRYIVIYGSGFTRRRVQVLAGRRPAGVWGWGGLVGVPLRRPGLARPAGSLHAAPHAAAELQPPHVAHHGGGVERLLMREKE